MAATLKRLAGPALISNAAATKYTAPAAGAIVRHVRVSNPSGSAVTFTLSVGADAAGTRLYDAFSIPAGTVIDWYPILPLTNGEIIQALAGTTNVTTLTISGTDLT